MNQNKMYIIQWISLLIPIMMLVAYVFLVAIRNQYLYKMNYIKYNVAIYSIGMIVSVISCILLLRYNLSLMESVYDKNIKLMYSVMFGYSAGMSILNFHMTEYSHFLKNTFLCKKVLKGKAKIEEYKLFPSIVLFYAARSENNTVFALREIEKIVKERLKYLESAPVVELHPFDRILRGPQEEKETLNLILQIIPKNSRYEYIGEILNQMKE